MGRRPNAVVSTYFTRGEKLADSSNRYSHTCKRCNEFFPKGRVDSLMSHILRRCPNVSPEDRQMVFRAMNQSHLEGPLSVGNQMPQPPENFEQIDSVQYEVPPSFLQREQSALDTLAEVSRRHLDYSSQQPSAASLHQQPAYFNAGHEFSDQDLLAQLKAACADHPNHTNLMNNAGLTEDQVRIDQPNGLPSVENLTTSAAGALPLVQTASAANAELEQTEQSPSALDPEHEVEETEPETQAPATGEAGNRLTWNPTTATTANAFASGMTVVTPFNESNPGLGMLQKPAKSKIRNKFSDSRRREVQEVRKRGACLRCRMLKKPCSGGNPCNTCKSVESARLWKGTCLRTRLADEFTLWSTGLFHARAAIGVSSAVHLLPQEAIPGRIEVNLFTSSGLHMTFAARKYLVNPGAVAGDDHQIDPGLLADSAQASSDLLVLGEQAGSQVEGYIQQVYDSSTAQEKSPFLKATVRQALEIVRAEPTTVEDSPEVPTSRAAYNLQDQLLRSVVELWAETAVLACLKHDDIKINYNPTKQADSRSTTITDSPDDDSSTHLSGRSRELVFAQLLAAVETRCSALSKVVLLELARRLLQRQQVSRFATFISSILLLNCIERMTGLYRSFDPVKIPDPNPSLDSNTSKLRPGDWPLDDPPRKLWLQGEHFAELLIMLLRMRALPPKTYTTMEGKVVVDQSQTISVNIGSRTPREQMDEQTTIPAAWLDPIQLKEDDLLAIRDGGLPDPEKHAKGWDLRFISRVLLPEKKDA